jgi:hypothetical protein
MPMEYDNNMILKLSANICSFKLVIENVNEEFAFAVNLYRDAAITLGATSMALAGVAMIL